MKVGDLVNTLLAVRIGKQLAKDYHKEGFKVPSFKDFLAQADKPLPKN